MCVGALSLFDHTDAAVFEISWLQKQPAPVTEGRDVIQENLGLFSEPVWSTANENVLTSQTLLKKTKPVIFIKPLFCFLGFLFQMSPVPQLTLAFLNTFGVWRRDNSQIPGSPASAFHVQFSYETPKLVDSNTVSVSCMRVFILMTLSVSCSL